MRQNLKETAITQWQLGDWNALAQGKADSWLTLSARIELGETGALEDPEFIDADVQSQVDLLLSAAHNGLGRVALLLNKQQEAEKHFQKALEVGAHPGDPRILAPLRLAYQASQLGLKQDYSIGPELNTSQPSRPAIEQNDHTAKLYAYLDKLLIQVAEQGKGMELDHQPVFAGKDPFMAGKTILAVSCWVTEFQPGDPTTIGRVQQARKIIHLLENEKSESWGAYFYLKGLKQLHDANLLEACFSFNHLMQLKETLHWNSFVDSKTYQLKKKPTNFYQVAYAISQLRFQLGWEDAEPSYQLLEALQRHYEEVSGEFGFADETRGEGRYDRYSFLLVAEIAHRLREAGLPLPENLKRSLRNSANYVLLNLNVQGDGFQYGRSIGAYGDSAFVEILTAAAWYGLLSAEETKAAHYFSCLCTQKFVNYWWDTKRGSVNLWEDGRATDGYRGKHRILGENFSLIYQHIYTQEIWQELGYQKPEYNDKKFREWLEHLPRATLTWFHKGLQGEDQQAVCTYRDGDRVFNTPLVNGEIYSKQSSYLPIPYIREVVQGQPDVELPLLIPEIKLKTKEVLWPISRFTDVSIKRTDDCCTLSWKQELDGELKLESCYRFKEGSIEREDCLIGKIDSIESIRMEWPEMLSTPPAIQSEGSTTLTLYGYKPVKDKHAARCKPESNIPQNMLKLGWSLTY